MRAGTEAQFPSRLPNCWVPCACPPVCEMRLLSLPLENTNRPCCLNTWA